MSRYTDYTWIGKIIFAVFRAALCLFILYIFIKYLIDNFFVAICIVIVLSMICIGFSSSRKEDVEEEKNEDKGQRLGEGGKEVPSLIEGDSAFEPVDMRGLLSILNTSEETYEDRCRKRSDSVGLTSNDLLGENYLQSCQAYILQTKRQESPRFFSFIARAIDGYREWKMKVEYLDINIAIKGTEEAIGGVRARDKRLGAALAPLDGQIDVNTREPRVGEEFLALLYDAILFRICSSGSNTKAALIGSGRVSGLELRNTVRRAALGDEWLTSVLSAVVVHTLENEAEALVRLSPPIDSAERSCAAQQRTLLSFEELDNECGSAASRSMRTDVLKRINDAAASKGSLGSASAFRSSLSKMGVDASCYLDGVQTRSSGEGTCNVLGQEARSFIRDNVFYAFESTSDASQAALALVKLALDAAAYRSNVYEFDREDGLLRHINQCLNSVHLPIEEVPFFFQRAFVWNVGLYGIGNEAVKALMSYQIQHNSEYSNFKIISVNENQFYGSHFELRNTNFSPKKRRQTQRRLTDRNSHEARLPKEAQGMAFEIDVRALENLLRRLG